MIEATTIELPDINEILQGVGIIDSGYNNKTKTINEWVILHRQNIVENQKLINKTDEISKVQVFKILIIDFLMRAMKGERGVILRKSIDKRINYFSDLNTNNYSAIFRETNYRWGAETGIWVLKNVTQEINRNYGWEWIEYFSQAENNHESNFQDDPFLKIKYISYKVRDLALSNFNNKYIANDLHVVRIATRLGLLNYGFNLIDHASVEMGNNPSSKKQYLFLHKLFHNLSQTTNGKYSPVDIDRSFWHFGRTICKSKPKCSVCPIKEICLTGKVKNKQL